MVAQVKPCLGALANTGAEIQAVGLAVTAQGRGCFLLIPTSAESACSGRGRGGAGVPVIQPRVPYC